MLQPDFTPFLAAPNPLSEPPVPVYSATGFDLLTILARVVTRPNPKVFLGPVDLTCSFVVVDTRRFDHPIIYCSPNFTTLTGYSEAEVIGRNCRFLQSPDGDIRKGDIRTQTSHEAVAHLKKSLLADKECQTSIVNYKKDGTPFINLVTIIPVAGGVSNAPGEENDYVYQVGFQIDLTEQPNAILEKLRHGSYLVNYSSPTDFASRQALQQFSARDRKAHSIPQPSMSQNLKQLLADQSFLDSIPISTGTTSPASAQQDESSSGGANHPLHLMLLEAAPDFIHVVSLKGSFLYVAPSVRRVLGYEPEEMISTSIADYAHPEDVIPLMRELKESSATTGGPADGNSANSASSITPRSVNLLFRARTKMGRYVWVECRGRLHVEPGKGRKAIVLTGRAREMANLKWEDVKAAGGLTKGSRVIISGQDKPESPIKLLEQEVWGLISGHGRDTMTWLSIGKGVVDVLGWKMDDLVGRSVLEILVDESTKNLLGGIVTNFRTYQSQKPQPSSRDTRMRKVRCSLKKKGGSSADVWFIIYRADPNHDDNLTSNRMVSTTTKAGLSISPAPLVYQIRLADAETFMPGSAGVLPRLPFPTSTVSSDLPLSSSEPTSSLAGALSSPSLASDSSLSSTLLASTDRSMTPTEVFEELSTARGSSWQYELQQLRFANVRLREELAALDVSEDASSGSSDETSARLARLEEDPPTLASSRDPVAYKNCDSSQGSQPSSQHQTSSVPSRTSYCLPRSSMAFGNQSQSMSIQSQNLSSDLQSDWAPDGSIPVATTMAVSRNGTALKRPWGHNL